MSSGVANLTSEMERFQKKMNRLKKQAECQARRYADVRAWAVWELGGVCFYCGGTENLEIHDIVPVLEGHGKRRGWTTVKRWLMFIPVGLMRLVCRECHVKHEHNGNTSALKKIKNGGKKNV